MSQFGMVISNESGAAFRGDVNSAIAALVTNNSGAAEPTTKYAYMFWHDTANSLLKMRNAANSAWVIVLDLTTTAARFQIAAGTLGSPSLAFAGSLTTGLYLPAADTLALVAAGVEYLRISAAGAIFQGTGAIIPPTGTTGQRPGSPVAGMVRYNSTTGTIEGYFSGQWTALGGASSPVVATKTTAYTATILDDLILSNCTTAISHTLYAANATGRKDLIFQNIGAFVATILPGGGDAIFNLNSGTTDSSLIVPPGSSVTIRPDGVNTWYPV